MDKLAWGFCVAFAATSWAACHSDESAEADGRVRRDSGYEALIVPEGGAEDAGTDQQASAKCDPSTLGKYCVMKACTKPTDCPPGEQCGEDGYCTTVTSCGKDNVCYTWSYYDWGICSCRCEVDDPSTAVSIEDSCPELGKNECVEVESRAAYCLRRCEPALGTNPCGEKLACKPGSGSAFDVWDKAYCVELGCTGDSDCKVWTSTVCDTRQKNCGAGETCLPDDIQSTCEEDAECNSGYYCLDYDGIKACTSKTGVCGKPGTCDLASGLCDQKPVALSKESAQVGDACQDDTECGRNMRCVTEFDPSRYLKEEGSSCQADSECCSGNCSSTGQCAAGNLCAVQYRNGYCTVEGCIHAKTLHIAQCPVGSTCNRFYGEGGMCQRSCDLTTAESCRGNSGDRYGDYECRDWSNFTMGGVKVAATPTCDFGLQVPCDFFANLSDIDCTDFGLKDNPTNMRCRLIDGTVASKPKDPHGYCLDETASGPKPAAQ